MNDRDRLGETLKHARAYAWRFIMQTFTNAYKMFVSQQIAMTIIAGIITLGVYIWKGLITAEATSQNIQAALAIIGITLLIALVISLIRTPFQLDREREERIKELEKYRPAPITFLDSKNLKFESPAKEETLEPNIKALEISKVLIRYNEHTRTWEEDAHGDQMTVIKFRNVPIKDEQILTLRGVRTEITFCDRKGNPQHTLDEGSWVKWVGTTVNFDRGTPQRLIVCTETENKRIKINSGEYLNNTYYRIIVRLYDSETWMEEFNFDLRIKNGIGSLTSVEEISN